MGVTVWLFVGPASGQPLTVEQFKGLLVTTLEHRLVQLPFTIMEGTFDVYPIGLSYYLHRGVGDYGSVRVLYQGTTAEDIDNVFNTLPFGKTDFCVWFENINWENETLAANFREQGYSGVDVIFYAFAQSQTIQLVDAYTEAIQPQLQFTHYMCMYGKRGVSDIRDTPFEPIVETYFGADFTSGTSWG